MQGLLRRLRHNTRCNGTARHIHTTGRADATSGRRQTRSCHARYSLKRLSKRCTRTIARSLQRVSKGAPRSQQTHFRDPRGRAQCGAPRGPGAACSSTSKTHHTHAAYYLYSIAVLASPLPTTSCRAPQQCACRASRALQTRRRSVVSVRWSLTFRLRRATGPRAERCASLEFMTYASPTHPRTAWLPISRQRHAWVVALLHCSAIRC